MTTMNVGVKELKANLSEYISKAADGTHIVITVRGKPVVEMQRLSDLTIIEQGVKEGWITPPRRSGGLGPAYPVQASPGTPTIQEMLDEDREDRF